MQKLLRSVFLVVLCAAVTTALFAAGGSSATPAPQQEDLTPEQEAIELYNSGIANRDRAWKLEEKLEKTTDAKERGKLESKVDKAFSRAASDFRKATEKNPQMHAAWSDLGYCLRRQGDFSASLEAYDTALSIEPRYAEAVEYRAETYLALNRLDEAKEAYMQLFNGARPMADKLLEAMQGWVVDTRDNGGAGVDPGQLDEFAGWVAERAEMAGQTKSVSQLRTHGW